MPNDQVFETAKETVIARLEVLSPEIHFSSGNGKDNISRDDMIRHVRMGDEIGREYVKTQLEFLQAFKDPNFMNRLAEA